jgi:hypothetical protein
MKTSTANRLAMGIHMFKLDGVDTYTHGDLAKATGVSKSTIKQNRQILEIIDFAINKERYQVWNIFL